jgi:hypothetical protein
MARKRIEYANNISDLLFECFFPILYVKVDDESINNNPYSYTRINYNGLTWEQREELKEVSMSFETNSYMNGAMIWAIQDFFEDFYDF